MEAYLQLMGEDIKKINDKFEEIMKTGKYYTLTDLHGNIFAGKKDLIAIDTYEHFQKHYIDLQKFVYYTYIKKLPLALFMQDLEYPKRSEMDTILKTYKFDEIEYTEFKTKKGHNNFNLEFSGVDGGNKINFFSVDGGKKKVKKSPRKKSTRKRSKKRSKVIYLK